jgi:DNA-binding Lrp family transcriptional regulator
MSLNSQNELLDRKNIELLRLLQGDPRQPIAELACSVSSKPA